MRSTGYIINGKYVRIADIPPDATAARKQPLHGQYEVDRMREDFRKDLIQPYVNGKPNPDFIDAYPKESEQYGFVNGGEKNV